MPKISYRNFNPSTTTLDKIKRANAIIVEYQAQGFQLTLRQLYYQFVSRGFIPNNDKEYKNLGNAINDGRMAGLIDWDAIYDRTRNLVSNSHWTSPSAIIDSAYASYAVDKWIGQPYRCEVWVEKDALVGVIEGVCRELDVPYIACRGYMSQSEMWSASQRLIRWDRRHSQQAYIIHLGDHDPSGIDMTRDITDRQDVFGVDLRIDRIALNWDQVEQYQPPPNPAKLTDSRVDGYIAKFGDESWELDALEPRVIADLIRETVLGVRDEDAWQDQIDLELEGRNLLRQTSERWDDVVAHLSSNGHSEDQGAVE